MPKETIEDLPKVESQQHPHREQLVVLSTRQNSDHKNNFQGRKQAEEQLPSDFPLSNPIMASLHRIEK